MARRQGRVDEEKRSYAGLWLVLSLFLFVGALWAVADDNVFRRPWKRYQAEFNRLEIRRLEEAIAAEQTRLDGLEAYQAAAGRLATAEEGLAGGETAAKLAALRGELTAAQQADQSKDLNLRFVKSELEELRYLYDDALHHGRPTDEIARTITAREALKAERAKIYGESQDRIAGLEAEIKALEAGRKAAEDAIAELTTTRDDLQQRLENVSLGWLPGPTARPPFVAWNWQPKIPKIQQAVLPGFDRNNFDQMVERVDRCTTCHTGIDKPGFDDQPNPWRTHPDRELLLGNHPPDKFGCTPCHNGDGPAVNSARKAHGNFLDADGEWEDVPFMEHPLFRGEKMQANCIKCHEGVQHLPGAEAVGRGERLFEMLGCHGCHLTEGYEHLAKVDGVSVIAPSLRRIAAKVDAGWLVRWIKNPHEFRPRTRMPNFMFDEDQAVAIAAYLLATSQEPSAAWRADHPPPPAPADGAAVARGKALVDSVGCRACHAFAPGEVAGQLGANKDIAPNLAGVAEKTDAQWLYHWIRNPRAYSPVARMPSLRLSDDEAEAVTAYLLTLGRKAAAPADLAARLADPANLAAGEKLVRTYGCPGCHDIQGMEKESRIGAELSTFGSKTREELFFGDRTDLKETWDVWTFHKLRTPRTYATEWIEQVMPTFDLADEDIEALRVFLASRTESEFPERYHFRPPGLDAIVAGRLIVDRYNCTGCHPIEGRGGDIRRLYEAEPTLAPPSLIGEGRKVQSAWLYGFLKEPTPIRPWLAVRMPTFGLSDAEADSLVEYFDAQDGVAVQFVHLTPAAFSPANLEAGRLLMSKEYFDCFSCHQRGTVKPEGPPEGWAPDLALAHERLNPAWIVEWLRDPQALMPGTKMPSFYPGGPPEVLDGDEEAQIQALRDYIMSLGMPGGAPAPQQVAEAPRGAPEASE
jgi:cytochrome c1